MPHGQPHCAPPHLHFLGSTPLCARALSSSAWAEPRDRREIGTQSVHFLVRKPLSTMTLRPPRGCSSHPNGSPRPVIRPSKSATAVAAGRLCAASTTGQINRRASQQSDHADQKSLSTAQILGPASDVSRLWQNHISSSQIQSHPRQARRRIAGIAEAFC